MSTPVPPALRGLWRRERITAPGFEDTTTEVLWLQTETWYADLRVPADRPTCAPARSAADCTPDQRRALARVQGFCGELSVHGDVCIWRRDLDLHPAGDLPDEGAYELRGDVLVERGIHAEYEEIWRRVAGSDGPTRAIQLAHGLIVTAGDHFLTVEDKRAVRPASSLADLAANDPDYLNLAICYGRTSPTTPWTVLRANLPWLEATSLSAALQEGAS